MDLFDKAKKIIITSLLILYNINLVLFTICALTLVAYRKQQRLGANEEL
jgi:cell division protein FtsL